MIKRFLTLFLVLALLVCPLDVFAAEREIAIAGTSLQAALINDEAMQLLSALDILSVSENTDTYVTRQQFVDYVARMIKIDSSKNEKIFADTENESVAHTFAKMNFLKIDQDKTFRPLDAITYEEACIILVRVLGYEEYISRLGGSVHEYMRIAKKLGIELKKSVGDKLIFVDVVKLLADALNAQIFEPVSIGKGAEYAQTDTLLKRIYDVYCIEGIFNANEWTSAYRDVSSPGKGRIIIDRITLDATNTEYGESMLLGQRVKAYVKDANNGMVPKVVLVVPDKKMEVYSFSSKDFEGADGDTVEFYVEGKEKKISLNYPTLIYNGVADFDAGLQQIISLMDNYNAYITVVKETSSDSNAVVFVDEYKVAEITSVDSAEGFVYAKDAANNSYKIPLLETGMFENVRINNLQSGERTTIESFNSGDIIFFGFSNSGNAVTVYHCTKTVQGTVEKMSNGTANNYAVIEGAEYEINAELLGKNLQPGMVATFYLGMDNEIIAVKDAENVWQTGYIYHIISADEVFSTTNYKFRVYTQDGTFKNFTCAKKYVLDGVLQNDDEAFYGRIAPGGTVNDNLRLFRYKANAEGELKNIDTAALLKETPEDEKTLRLIGNKLARTFRKDTNSGYMLFEAKRTTSGTTITPSSGENRSYPYPVNKSTEIFSVPHTAEYDAVDKNFTHSTVEKSDHISKDKNATCAFYNTDVNSEYVSIIVNYRNPMLNYSEKSNPYLINDVGIETMDEDGNIYKCLELITTLAVSTGKLTYTVPLNIEVEFTDVKGNKTVKTDAEVVASLSPGDVIQYGGGSAGQTGSIRVLYDYDADDPNSSDDDNRGQVYWGWQDEAENTLSSYTYRYSNATSSTNLSVDFIGAYGYLLDSAIDADTQAQDDAYGRTASSCYVFLGAAGTEGTDEICGSAGWATGYRRLTMYDNQRRQSKAFWGIFTDLVNYKSSQSDYYYVLLFNGSSNYQGNCAVFYKR